MTPRPLHPGAWWLWAIALCAAALRTRNPLLLGLVAAVVWFVVASRRVEAPWSRSFGSFARMGGFVVGLRLVFQVLFAARLPGHELFSIPAVDLPSWLSGVTLGGPVTAESLLGGLYQGLQLAVVLLCVGAANSLASPNRLLRCLPTVLYEAGVVVTVALAFAPSASVTASAVRDARRLRGRPHRGPAGLRGMAVPVLEGALERSLQLAASMDSRGYGRTAAVEPGRRRFGNVVLAAGLLAVSVGVYALVDSGSSHTMGLALSAAGGALLAVSLGLGGARSTRTRYRPDPWRLPEWLTVGVGAAALAALVVAGRLGVHGLSPSTSPIQAPPLPLLPAIGILLALLPAFATPEPVL